jgi:methylenetetrahydrofolate dehydrogenase (NADP+)/methenyltetrahydrofolate cyclohydrolase
MKIIPGKIIAEKILENVKQSISQMALKPVLKIYYIGDSKESAKYIEKKISKGKEVGVNVLVETFPDDVDLSKLSDSLIKDGINSEINGIIIQLPVKNPAIKDLFQLIPVSKDVDGLNPLSLGLLWHDDEFVLIPATAKAIIKTLEYVSEDLIIGLNDFLSGKNCLIINRSLIIGKPVASILLKNDATVIIAHSKTKNIEELILKSKIIISATGIAGFLNKYKFSPNTIIIDSGFKQQEGKVFGDVVLDETFGDNASLGENIDYLSPVPLGVGPIGVACLLENTFLASKRK